jgi:hypothetical protein
MAENKDKSKKGKEILKKLAFFAGAVAVAAVGVELIAGA